MKLFKKSLVFSMKKREVFAGEALFHRTGPLIYQRSYPVLFRSTGPRVSPDGTFLKTTLLF